MSQDLYDPKLKEVMAEVRAVYRKHDLAGYIVLLSATHGEFGFEITPSWSGAKWEDDNVRFKIRPSEVGEEKAAALAENTTRMVIGIGDLCRYGMTAAMTMIQALRTQLNIECGETTITPHREQ